MNDLSAMRIFKQLLKGKLMKVINLKAISNDSMGV